LCSALRRARSRGTTYRRVWRFTSAAWSALGDPQTPPRSTLSSWLPMAQLKNNGSWLSGRTDQPRTSALLSKLAIIHRSQCPAGVPSPLERCAGFRLHVRRIVRVSTEQQMREYLACVARGLDDASFSLCTGVPVQRVAVLRSGACGSGLIAVATSESDVRTISVTGVDGTSETQGERCSAAHAISTSASASAHTDTPHACKKRKITSGAEWMLLNFVDNSHKQCTQGIARCETRQQVAATAAKELYAAVTGVGREVGDPVPAVLTVLFEIPSGTVPENSQDYVVLGEKEVLDHQLLPEGTVRVLTQRK
jgi:hypothetical protein